MALWEGESGDEFYSYYDWVVEVGKPGAGSTLYVIEDKEFNDLGERESRTFYSDALPFDVVLSGYKRNALPRPEGGPVSGHAEIVDGFWLASLPDEKEAERNGAGVYVTAVDKATGEETKGILWGWSTDPFTVESGADIYTIGMDRKRWKAPFTIRLEDFTADMHAGTTMASHFESEVTKIQDGNEERIRIWMNHPLRDQGYTFFQDSWAPHRASIPRPPSG